MKMKPHRKIRSMQIKLAKAMKATVKIRHQYRDADLWAKLADINIGFDTNILPIADLRVSNNGGLSLIESIRLGYEMARDHETVTYYEGSHSIAIFWSEESEAKIEKVLAEFEELATPYLNEAVALEVHNS